MGGTIAKTIGKATAAQIKEWKSKHKDVRVLTQTDENGDVHYTYIKKPKIEDSEYARSVGDDDGIKIGLAIVNAVRLGGSEVVMEDDQLKQGIMKSVLTLIKPIQAEIAKL